MLRLAELDGKAAPVAAPAEVTSAVFNRSRRVKRGMVSSGCLVACVKMQPPTIAPSKTVLLRKNKYLQRPPSRPCVTQNTPLVPDTEIYRGCGGLDHMNPVMLTPPVKAPDSSRVRFKNFLFATDLAAPS